MKKGFTLVELIIVIVIIGVLAAIALSQYTKVVEKSRASEARLVLGTLRTAEIGEYKENDAYAAVSDLGVGAPDGVCQDSHYFSYACDTDGFCTATRCTTGGKNPNGTFAWTKALDIAGSWSGTAGY